MTTQHAAQAPAQQPYWQTIPPDTWWLSLFMTTVSSTLDDTDNGAVTP